MRRILITIFATVLALPASGALSASGLGARSFTGIGAGAEIATGSNTNFNPTIGLTQGVTGWLSYYGTVAAGYRFTDPGIMARATVEFYLLFFGLYGGVQSNTGTDRAADYGFPLGLCAGLPDRDISLRLHLGSIIYTRSHANEFQAAISAYFRIW